MPSLTSTTPCLRFSSSRSLDSLSALQLVSFKSKLFLFITVRLRNYKLIIYGDIFLATKPWRFETSSEEAENVSFSMVHLHTTYIPLYRALFTHYFQLHRNVKFRLQSGLHYKFNFTVAPLDNLPFYVSLS